MSPHAAILVALASLTSSPATGAPMAAEWTCALIEGVPEAGAPVRATRRIGRLLVDIANPKATPKQLSKRFDALERHIARALTESKRVFHDKPRRAWNAGDKKRAARFLEKHVLGQRPTLHIGAVGFEPRPGVRAAMMSAACRAGRYDDAIRWGRRASRPEEASARAFAALLLWQQGELSAARELIGGGQGDSFLTAWITAELSTDPEERRRQRAAARRRTTTEAQRRAVTSQAARARSCK